MSFSELKKETASSSSAGLYEFARVRTVNYRLCNCFQSYNRHKYLSNILAINYLILPIIFVKYTFTIETYTYMKYLNFNVDMVAMNVHVSKPNKAFIFLSRKS